MGMGEPLLNLPSVLRAHQALTRDLGIGARRITISTVGVPNAIARLAAADLQSTLAVSIHAASQQLREQLIPRSAPRFGLTRASCDLACGTHVCTGAVYAVNICSGVQRGMFWSDGVPVKSA